MIKVSKSFDVRFIDASRLACFGRCEARFVFQCLMGLHLPDEQTINLDYGTAMHKALPKMYSGETQPAFDAFSEAWRHFPYGEENDTRNTALSRDRITHFALSHAPENCPYEILHFDFSSPTELISENEVPFAIDIGAEYPYLGRIDQMIKWKATGDIWAYDFKTSRELSPRYFEGFWNSPQAVGYTIASEQLFDKKIQGLAIEGMRISKSNIENQIGFVYVSAINKKIFIDETKLNCARIHAANEARMWRQNFAACSTYACYGFPSKVCSFRLLCDCGEAWEASANLYEHRKPFNPLEKGE